MGNLFQQSNDFVPPTRNSSENEQCNSLEVEAAASSFSWLTLASSQISNEKNPFHNNNIDFSMDADDEDSNSSEYTETTKSPPSRNHHVDSESMSTPRHEKLQRRLKSELDATGASTKTESAKSKKPTHKLQIEVEKLTQEAHDTDKATKKNFKKLGDENRRLNGELQKRDAEIAHLKQQLGTPSDLRLEQANVQIRELGAKLERRKAQINSAQRDMTITKRALEAHGVDMGGLGGLRMVVMPTLDGEVKGVKRSGSKRQVEDVEMEEFHGAHGNRKRVKLID